MNTDINIKNTLKLSSHKLEDESLPLERFWPEVSPSNDHKIKHCYTTHLRSYVDDYEINIYFK